jgi:hypothetical protein
MAPSGHTETNLLVVRFRGEEDMPSPPMVYRLGANDPSLPFNDQFCCDAQRGIPATMW